MTASAPRVSVVVPTYNYARFLPRALDSALRQTFRDFEVIVVDDGSTDDTPVVAGRYGDAIRYVRKQNGGVSSARNLGVEMARGEMIAFLDADDEWSPWKLERQVAFMDGNTAYGMSFTDMSHSVDGVEVHHSYLHERSYRYLGSGRIRSRLLRECFIFVPTVMARAACLAEAGPFDPGMSNAEDLAMWLRVARVHEIGFLDEPLTIRHAHGSGATADPERYFQGQITLFRKLLAADREDEDRPIMRQRLAEAYWHLGYHYFRKENMNGCRRNMLLSAKHGKSPSAWLKYLLLSSIPCGLQNVLRSATGRNLDQG